MTEKEKALLLKDLCARLPYEVIVKYKSREKEGNVKITSGNIGYVAELGNGWWKECKPYLRPISSMTEEEANEVLVSSKIIHSNINSRGFVWTEDCSTYIDWLNAHHFDYRGLIKKGLALEATEDMYNIK